MVHKWISLICFLYFIVSPVKSHTPLPYNWKFLCQSTPISLRTIGCSIANPCSSPGMMNCFSGICCARSVAIAAVLRNGQLSKGGCEDVTIVGAGISGTYAAWRLRHSNLRIGVYEFSHRVGGRMFTEHFADAPDLNIEHGAMRIKPEEHKRMMKLAVDLGLQVRDFVEGFGKPNRTFYFLRGHRLLTKELGTSSRTPYFLRPEEFRPPEDLTWYISSTFTNYTAPMMSTNELDDEIIRLNSVTIDGVPLYRQSAREVYDKTISSEAYRYLLDYVGFHMFQTEIQATDPIPAGPPSNSVPNLNTIGQGGMNAFPVNLLRQFLQSSARHTYTSNRRLIQIRQNIDGTYTLTFSVTVREHGYTLPTPQIMQVCSKRVILAVPPGALNEIDWPPLRLPHAASLISTVYDNVASKVFLLYPYRWWLKLPSQTLRLTHTKSDLPNRQTYDFGQSATGNAALLISYTDGETDVTFWRNLQKRGQCKSRVCDSNMVTDEVIRHAHIHLSQIYNVNINDIPYPIDGRMQTWNEYPFYAAWGVWKPGVNFIKAMNDVLNPNPEHDIYILNGHFALRKYSGWGEGSLHSGDIVLKKYFGIPPYISQQY